MDLKETLKSLDPGLSQKLDQIKISAEEIWKTPLLPWFTNHDVSHSEEIINLLEQILSGLQTTDQKLSEHELFILLASAYLHDIGMQDLKKEKISMDKLSPEDYDSIRKTHAQKSYDWISKRLVKFPERDDISFPSMGDDYLRVIAWVSKGHSTDFFEESVGHFKKNPIRPANKRVRGELLTALLMIADELDLHNKRVDFVELTKFNLSGYSAVHWFKHHYVDGVEIKSGTVLLTLTFHPNDEDCQDLVKELIEVKLKEQLERVNPIFRNSTRGLLTLNNQPESSIHTDETKRKIPDEALNELRKMLKRDEKPESHPQPSISDSLNPVIIPKPTELFTGRTNELKRFGEAFRQSSLISIEGLGGIGKTEFAARCIEEAYIHEEKVVWFECFPDTKLDSLIDASGYGDVLKGESKTERAKYSGFTDLAERDGKIIFLDNFQDATDDSFRQFFVFSVNRFRKARFIFIAREHPSLGSAKISPVELEGLEKDSLAYARKAINAFYRGVSIDDEDLKKVCEAVGGHPLAIDHALQLLNYGETPENIVGKFFHLKDQVEELTHRLLDEVFNHPKSTEEEKKILIKFSVFRTRVSIVAIDFLSSDPDKKAAFFRLIDKKMIMHTTGPEGPLYGTHPLVREFCYRKITDPRDLHLKACEYLRTRRKEKLDPSLEEEIFFHLVKGERFTELADLVAERGEDFILIGHINFLMEMIHAAREKGTDRAEFYLFCGDIAQIRGEWNEALNRFEEAFSFPGVEDKTSAMAYLKYGEILYRKGEVKKSLKYFEDAYELCREIGFKKGEARSLNDMGLVNETFGDLDKAKKQIEDALSLIKHMKGEPLIGTFLNNIGGVLDTKGDTEGALEKYNESLKIREEIGDKQGIAATFNNIGGVLDTKGDTEGALEKYNESLKISEEIGDKEVIATTLNNIGGVLDTKGDTEGALKKYNESLKIREEIGDKEGIATALNNIGGVLDTKGDMEGALKKYNESLKIREEIGDKQGIAVTLGNIGYVLIDRNFPSALEHFFKSLALEIQMGIDRRGTENSIWKIRNKLGLKKFQDLAEEAFQKLPEDLKPYVNIREFTKDETIRKDHKTGRNDPCPCGSGKKFKKCCGASL